MYIKLSLINTLDVRLMHFIGLLVKEKPLILFQRHNDQFQHSNLQGGGGGYHFVRKETFLITLKNK